ncbi:MAG: hypothetical protein ACI8TQ_004028 [Planctomycetota bacterium]|jgi:hypothetical protein
MKIIAIVLTICCFSSACQSVELYSKRRVDDFRDCFALAIAPGTGDATSLAVGIELPGPFPFGLGVAEGTAYGMVGRKFGATQYSVENATVITTTATVAILYLLAMTNANISSSSGLDLDFLFDKDQSLKLSRSKRHVRNKDRSFRVGAHAALSSTFVYADVELAEIADLFLGLFFGIDFMKDDVRTLKSNVTPEPS